ncbi:sensor histidine kinase [Streptomyces iconiensis]
MAGLLALAVGRALVDGAPHPAAIVASAVALGAVYAAGPLIPSIGRRLPAAAVWLLTVGAAWLVLLAQTPDGLWLAFPLYFLMLHLLPPRAGLISVVVTALAGATGYTAHQDSFSVAVFLGPVLGAAFAVATVFGYQALYRESEERRRLIQQLTTARANLESVGREAGMMAERERLAREIHDTLAQGLSSIQLLLSAAERSLGTAGGQGESQGPKPSGPGANTSTAEPKGTPPTSSSSTTTPATTAPSKGTPAAGAASSPAPPTRTSESLSAAEGDADTVTAARYVAQARKAAQDNLAEARRFVHALVPPDLEGVDASLHVALEQLSDTTTVRHGVPVHFHLSGTPSPLPTPYEVAVLRVAQSALANAVAHAEASSIEVTLSYMDRDLALDVVDNGAGFDPATLPPPEPGEGGFGLAAMRARARALGGSLSVESTPGHGTAIALQLPVSYADALKFPASLGYRP